MAKYKTAARFLNAIDGKIYEAGQEIELNDNDAEYFKQHDLIEKPKAEKVKAAKEK